MAPEEVHGTSTEPLTEQANQNHSSTNQEEEYDENEMIDVAERVIFRIAEQVVARRITVREVFTEKLSMKVIDGEQCEILFPSGLLDAIKKIGIENLTKKEEKYLLAVVAKPELGNIIMMAELL